MTTRYISHVVKLSQNQKQTLARAINSIESIETIYNAKFDMNDPWINNRFIINYFKNM